MVEKNLIIDNAQAFFAKPLLGIDTFYSPRKFVGVSDGGILATKKILEGVLKNEFTHALKIKKHPNPI